MDPNSPDFKPFEELLKSYTGRDIEYHQRYKTTGLEFAWFCFQAGVARGIKLTQEGNQNG